MRSWCRADQRQVHSAIALSAVHVFIITSARFRVGFEFLLVPLAAQGLALCHVLVSRPRSVFERPSRMCSRTN